VDPGIAATGYGLVEAGAGDEPRLLDHGVIRTPAGRPLAERLALLYDALGALIDAASPHAVAVEELFFSTNVATAMTVSQARGVVLLAAAKAGLPVGEYKPNVVKQSLTGYGRADKRQVQEMLRLTLGLVERPRPDDAADGIAVALCHLRMDRLQSLGEETD
jgi:crossover junction endodeoxyribonuclease RuvC